jgi:hypothetical protein
MHPVLVKNTNTKEKKKKYIYIYIYIYIYGGGQTTSDWSDQVAETTPNSLGGGRTNPATPSS